MNSSSLRQNTLTKTVAQINDCLFVYMKFKTIVIDHAFQHVPISVDAKNGLFVDVAYCITDHYFQAAAVKYQLIKFIEYPLCTLCWCTF